MARRWLGFTILCGAAFIAVHLFEWQHLLKGFTSFAHPFFALTALHMIHEAAGVLYLSILAMRHATAEDIEAASLYWYFVDVVWLILCPLLYLA